MEKNEKVLESVYLGRLTQPELSQCIDRQITEIEAQGPELLTDIPMNAMVGTMKTTAGEFDLSILQIQKSTFTDQLIDLDDVRDRALIRYQHALKNFSFSDDAEEQKAYRKLTTLSTTYKGIDKLNYEFESKDTDKFVAELESDTYKTEVGTLNLGTHVNRIKTSNVEFNQLFGSRSHEQTTKAVYDTLGLRKTLTKQYDHFARYILSLSTMLDKEPFNNTLKIMNTTRSYYDDLIKRRDGLKSANLEKPETVTTA